MTAEDINDMAEAINRKYGSRGPVLRKQVKVEPDLDEYTVQQIEAFAGERGYTLDEAVAIWLERHAASVHY